LLQHKFKYILNLSHAHVLIPCHLSVSDPLVKKKKTLIPVNYIFFQLQFLLVF